MVSLILEEASHISLPAGQRKIVSESLDWRSLAGLSQRWTLVSGAVTRLPDQALGDFLLLLPAQGYSQAYLGKLMASARLPVHSTFQHAALGLVTGLVFLQLVSLRVFGPS